jgi:F-box domain
MIFNWINFRGHLRLSLVCKRWNTLVKDDISFMRTVSFNAGRLNGHNQPLIRSYKHLKFCYYPDQEEIAENLQLLFKNAEIIDFGFVGRATINRIMPFCENLKEIQLKDIYPDSVEWTFTHPLPVKISTTDPCVEFFDRFSVIKDITLDLNSVVPSEDYMAKYGAVTNSLVLTLKTPLNLSRIKDLHLKYLRVWRRYNVPEREIQTEKSNFISFFGELAPFLQKIDITNSTIEIWFDPMRMFLKNLETVKFKCVSTEDLRLNDLKVLPKLQSLAIEVHQTVRIEHYHFNIQELRKLAEFRLSFNYVLKWGVPTLRIVSPVQPMFAMRQVWISNINADCETMEQLVHTMPELKLLDINCSVGLFEIYA